MSAAIERQKYVPQTLSTGASGMTTVMSGTATTYTAAITQNPVTVSPGPSQDDIEKSVYSYLRAIRALGKSIAGTGQIADALGLPISEVNSAVKNLTGKGVKIK